MKDSFSTHTTFTSGKKSYKYASLPVLIAPFVTCPAESVVDREKAKIAPASMAVQGLYALRRAEAKNGKGQLPKVLEYAQSIGL